MKTTTAHSCFSFIAAAALAVVSGAASAQAIPSPMNLPRSPLFLNSSVDPNVAVTLDDSGSMVDAFMPDTADDNCGWRHPRFYWSGFNRLYYNPAVRYTPPLDPLGVPFPDAAFGAAWYDGYENTDPGIPGDNRQGTRVVNLGTEFFPQRNMGANLNSIPAFTGTRVGHEPRLRPTAPDLTLAPNAGTTDPWFVNCTNPANTSVPTPIPPVTGGGSVAVGAGNAWLPFTSANNQTTGTQFRGTAGGTSAAFYYRFTGDPSIPAQVDDPRLYEAVNMTTASAAEQTNFANWYSYYRNRVLLARTALTRTFGVQDQGMRVVYQNLHQNLFVTGTTPFNRFAGAPRTAFFNLLYRSPAAGVTPNRAAMIRAGNLFTFGALDTTAQNPYWEGPPLNRELTCRQNFHVHLTDGFTNETVNPVLPGLVSGIRLTTNEDLPGPNDYDTARPETRLFSNILTPANSCGGAQCDPSLARVAFAYWATDLRPDLADNVPPFFSSRVTGVTGPAVGGTITDPASVPEIFWNPVNDPATWQHMVNYTVGLGVAGLRNFPGDYTALRTGGLAWPGLLNLAPEAVDDLWQAGLVSRGGYFSAGDPQELVDSLSAALTSVVARRGTASAATVTSSVLQASTLAFRTGFDSSDWTGQVFANKLDEDGIAIEPAEWEAGELLNLRTSADRVIITSATATGGGVPFKWGNLPAAYQAALDDDPTSSIIDSDGLGADRVEYIRGDRSLEVNNGGPFRIRNGLLGAVINSGAVVVAGPSETYTENSFPGGPEQSATQSYAQFRDANRNRRRLIYVGANDGMLHAFDAGSGITGFDAGGNPLVDLGSGQEVFAYVPREVAPYLSRMTNPTFEFTPYVDNSPVRRDVYIGSRWRTILVGGLRRGGQGVYALDVTNPNIVEGDAGDVVLWEFSDDVAGGERMGFSYARPNIARLANGKWVVVIAAAYNPEQNTFSEPQVAPPDPDSPAGGSTLFVLDALDGSIIRRFEFDPAQSRGLTSPTFGDYDDDDIDDFAVAGDLQGNLWRFDFTDPSPSAWSVVRMYRPAVNFVQPITVAPRLFFDPETDGLIAVFGTGKYLEAGDRSVVGVPTQSLYGVRDYGSTSPNYPITSGQLQAQTLTKVGSGATATFTVTSNAVPETVRGWRLPLLDLGERVVTTAAALFNVDVVVVPTIIPNGDDPCLPGLRGNLFALQGSTGGAPALDRDGDGVVTTADRAGTIGQAVSQSVAAGTLSGVISPGGGRLTLLDFAIGSAQPGALRGLNTPIWRRRSWREVSAED